VVGRTEARSEAVHENEPRKLAHVVLEVDQEFGEPSGIGPCVQPANHRGAIGVGPLDMMHSLSTQGAV
jgi:hypothetical protein